MEEEPVEIHKFVLYVSESNRLEDIQAPYVKKCLHLHLFLNSLDNFIVIERPRITKNQDGHVFTMKFVKENNADYFVRIHYQISNMKIGVSASTIQKICRQLGVYYYSINLKQDSVIVIFSKKKYHIFMT